MGAFLLYVAVALVLLLLADRCLVTISRAAAIVLLLLPLLLTGRANLRGEIYGPIDIPYAAEPFNSLRTDYGVLTTHTGALNDIFAQMIPWQQAVRHAFQQGEWPLWNPFMFAGDILAAAAQPAPYDPFHLIALLLPLDLAITFLATMTLFHASLSAYLFVRDLGCGEQASLVGAATWMLSAVLVFWNEWPLGMSMSLLPLLLLATRWVIIRCGFSGVLFLTIALVLLVLAGHPESALHVVVVAGVYGIYLLATEQGHPIPSILIRLVGAGALAFALCAFFLLPILDALPQTMEHQKRQVLGRGVSLAVPWTTALSNLPKNFVPFSGGLLQDEKVVFAVDEFPRAYPGSVALGLACLGLIARRRRERWLLLGFVLFGWLAGANASFPTRLLELLPVLRITMTDRFIVMASLGIAVLAAFGAERMVERRQLSALLFLGIAATLGLALVFNWPDDVLTPANVITHTLLLIVPPVLAAAAAWFLHGRGNLLLVFALLLAQRAGEEHGLYPTLPRTAFAPRLVELQGLPAKDPLYRFVSQGLTFAPNVSALYGLEDVRGYQAMTNRRWFETYPLWCAHQPIHFNRVDDLTRPFLSFLNVRFAFSLLREPVPEGWRVISEGTSVRLLENLRVLPRAFVPRRVRMGGSKELVEMAAETDFRERSWISPKREGPPLLEQDQDNGEGEVMTRIRGTGLVLRARMKEAGWIVVSETAWEGWRALLDGIPTPVFLANHAFLALRVPAGEHRIELVYLPASFIWGKWISGTTLIALLGVVLFRRR